MLAERAPALRHAEGSRAAAALAIALVALPLAGLAVLVAAPDLDAMWEHHPSHFWRPRRRRTGAAAAGARCRDPTGSPRRGSASGPCPDELQPSVAGSAWPPIVAAYFSSILAAR